MSHLPIRHTYTRSEAIWGKPKRIIAGQKGVSPSNAKRMILLM